MIVYIFVKDSKNKLLKDVCYALQNGSTETKSSKKMIAHEGEFKTDKEVDIKNFDDEGETPPIELENQWGDKINALYFAKIETDNCILFSKKWASNVLDTIKCLEIEFWFRINSDVQTSSLFFNRDNDFVVMIKNNKIIVKCNKKTILGESFDINVHQWHYFNLKIFEEDFSIQIDTEKKALQKKENITEILHSTLNSELLFFSQFNGDFLEFRIWRINRTEEMISELKTRPLKKIFDEANEVKIKLIEKPKKETTNNELDMNFDLGFDLGIDNSRFNKKNSTQTSRFKNKKLSTKKKDINNNSSKSNALLSVEEDPFNPSNKNNGFKIKDKVDIKDNDIPVNKSDIISFDESIKNKQISSNFTDEFKKDVNHLNTNNETKDKETVSNLSSNSLVKNNSTKDLKKRKPFFMNKLNKKDPLKNKNSITSIDRSNKNSSFNFQSVKNSKSSDLKNNFLAKSAKEIENNKNMQQLKLNNSSLSKYSDSKNNSEPLKNFNSINNNSSPLNRKSSFAANSHLLGCPRSCWGS